MIIIHDFRVPTEYTSSLMGKLPEAVLIPFKAEEGRVYPSISSHPDIYFFKLDSNTLIHSPHLDEGFIEGLGKKGLTLIEGEEKLGTVYPETARYNAARCGGFFFHNTSFTDKAILEKVQEKGLTSVNIPQGYARCSILSACENAIITSDEGIAQETEKRGFKTLLISNGHILLPGENYGFIGGTGGLTPDGRVIMLGDPRKHPDGGRIVDFLEENASGSIFLEGLPLYDAGGLFIFS